MKIFLGMLMVLIVSGDDEVTVNGILGENVLLPCRCQNRNLKKDFRWQKEEPKSAAVFFNNTFNDSYKGRMEIFLSEDISNCSLLLKNVTADDQGKYKCSFFVEDMYTRPTINLNVSAHFNVCMESATSQNDTLKVFHCHVEGRYRDAEILWNLEGLLLTNSSTTTVTHTHSLHIQAGVYSFNSTLVTELSKNTDPTCLVETRGISAINSTCIEGSGNPEPIRHIPIEPKYVPRYFKVIPVLLVLGFSLVLLGRWKLSQRDYTDERNEAV